MFPGRTRGGAGGAGAGEPPARTHTPVLQGLGGRTLPTSAGPRGGKDLGGGVVWAAGAEASAGLLRARAAGVGASLSQPPTGTSRPGSPAHFLPGLGRGACSAWRPSSAAGRARDRGRCSPGASRPPTHFAPRPSPARPHVSGCSLGKFFFFFLKLSLLSLLGATWWSSAGASRPPAPLPSPRPPSPVPGAGRLGARSALCPPTE